MAEFKPYPKPVKKEKESISKEQYKKLISQNKKNKYNAIRQTYNGRSYDSKLEAKYAVELDWMLKAGEVKMWLPQKTLKCIVNGHEVCRYSLDFYVEFANGKIEWWEVKSKATMTAAWRIKWKLVKALYPKENFVLKY